jgi:hypothetical protein
MIDFHIQRGAGSAQDALGMESIIYRSTILRTASIPVSRRMPGVAMTGATVAVVPVVEDFITV